MKKILVPAALALLFVTATSTGAIAKKNKTTDTLKLKQGYRLHLSAVDEEGTKVSFHLTNSNGDIIDDKTVLDDESFSLYDEEIKIVEVKNIQVFVGLNSWLIKLEDLVQYNKATGKIVSEIDETFLLKPKN